MSNGKCMLDPAALNEVVEACVAKGNVAPVIHLAFRERSIARSTYFCGGV